MLSEIGEESNKVDLHLVERGSLWSEGTDEIKDIKVSVETRKMGKGNE